MGTKIDPQLINLTYEAAFKSFWGKNALRRFLKECNLSTTILASWSPAESKGEFLNRLFQLLLKSQKGRTMIYKIAVSLSQQSSFPDLHNHKNSAYRISEAIKTVAELKAYLLKKEEALRNKDNKKVSLHQEKEELQPLQFEKKRLELQTRLDSIKSFMGKEEGNEKFHEWFFDLLDSRNIANVRQNKGFGIVKQGSFVFNNLNYLVDLYFTTNPAGVEHIDQLKSKINGSSNHDMGFMVSISGYSSDAVDRASKTSPPLILMNVNHLYLFLTGIMDFSEIISRMFRHLSKTGESYLPVNKVWLMEYNNIS